MAHILLVETSQGGHVAVRFADADAARTWEDAHSADVMSAGCVLVVGRAEALALARG